MSRCAAPVGSAPKRTSDLVATVRQWLAPEGAQFLATAFPQFTKINGTAFPVSALAYDATTAETAHWRFAALNYGSGNLTLTVYWYADTASSNGVVFEAAIAAITANTDTQDTETKAYATATNATDTHLGTTGQRLHNFDIVISNLDSIAANDWVSLKLGRLPANASDTMTGDCLIVGCMLAYSDT